MSDRLFDRLPVRISTSDLHHWILRKKFFYIRAYDFGVQFSFKFAGLGIPNPTMTAKNAFRTSKRAASHLKDGISGQGEMNHINHGQVVMEARTEHRGSHRQEHVANLNSTLAKFADDKQRIVRRAADHSIGAWLSVFPCAKQKAVLSPREFRDGLCMRYQLPLQHLHDRCDGCGAHFSLDHGLNCPKGGNVIEQHNEIRDMVGQLASMAYVHVTREPVVRESREHGDGRGLVCDLAVRGVWQPQTEALFDFRVCNADTQSYVNRHVTAVTAWQEQRRTSTRKLAGSATRISLPSSSPRTEFCNVKGSTSSSGWQRALLTSGPSRTARQ